jgi:hypothetical protein
MRAAAWPCRAARGGSQQSFTSALPRRHIAAATPRRNHRGKASSSERVQFFKNREVEASRPVEACIEGLPRRAGGVGNQTGSTSQGFSVTAAASATSNASRSRGDSMVPAEEGRDPLSHYGVGDTCTGVGFGGDCAAPLLNRVATATPAKAVPAAVATATATVLSGASRARTVRTLRRRSQR